MKTNEEKAHELYAYTCQLVSQLMYCSSKLREEEDFAKVTDEMINLVSAYEDRIKIIKKGD